MRKRHPTYPRVKKHGDIVNQSNVVGLLGGLGNQLFQYAFAVWLERQTGNPSRFDLSAYRTQPKYFALREFGLDPTPREDWLRFVPFPGGRTPRIATAVRRAAGPRKVHLESETHRLPNGSELRHRAWYYGYWQFPSMVHEVMPELRTRLARSTYERQPQPRNRIALHVRRGDMVGKSAELGPNYYHTALARLRTTHAVDPSDGVTVFSDDPDWCRRELAIRSAYYVERKTAAQDLHALGSHEFLVLSGSTFSWWASLLADRDPSTVCAPAPFVPGTRIPLDVEGWLPILR